MDKVRILVLVKDRQLKREMEENEELSDWIELQVLVRRRESQLVDFMTDLYGEKVGSYNKVKNEKEVRKYLRLNDHDLRGFNEFLDQRRTYDIEDFAKKRVFSLSQRLGYLKSEPGLLEFLKLI